MRDIRGLTKRQDAEVSADMQWIASQGILLDNFWAGEFGRIRALPRLKHKTDL